MAEEIEITPNWESVARFFAFMFADHDMVQGAYGAMASFVETVRYLERTNPDAIVRLIDELNAKDEPTDKVGRPIYMHEDAIDGDVRS